MKDESRKEEVRRDAAQNVEKADTRNSNIDSRRSKNKEMKEERRKTAQLQQLENTIAELEAQLSNLGAQLESPFVKPNEAAKLGTEYERVQREMDEKLGEWERMQG
jgi:hypothetical protein